MRFDIYEVEVSNSVEVFEFISNGPKGSIKKRVHYQKTGVRKLYNLAFGDVNIETDSIDDTIVTNNQDVEKVLATVATTLYAFMEKYPDARVIATGSTLIRTRLYRISISNNLEEIRKTFKVYGLLENKQWVVYEKNNNYSAFLIVKNT
jgi:hypothetical protein